MMIYSQQIRSHILRNNDTAKNKVWLIFHKKFACVKTGKI